MLPDPLFIRNYFNCMIGRWQFVFANIATYSLTIDRAIPVSLFDPLWAAQGGIVGDFGYTQFLNWTGKIDVQILLPDGESEPGYLFSIALMNQAYALILDGSIASQPCPIKRFS